MATNLLVEIVSPDGAAFRGEAVSFRAPGVEGGPFADVEQMRQERREFREIDLGPDIGREVARGKDEEPRLAQPSGADMHQFYSLSAFA